MVVMAEFSVPGGAFELGRLVADQPDAHIELERIVPAENTFMPFFWVRTDDFDSFETSLEQDDHVADIVTMAELDDRTLYHVRWAKPVNGFADAVVDSNAQILKAEGGDPWLFRMRFPTREALSAFYETCTDDLGIDLELSRVFSDEEALERTTADLLTPEQREALTLALDVGYFDIPRQTALGDIADDLGVTSQAASERVRRGIKTVLSAELPNDD
jgi:hypothetical protein